MSNNTNAGNEALALMTAQLNEALKGSKNKGGDSDGDDFESDESSIYSESDSD